MGRLLALSLTALALWSGRSAEAEGPADRLEVAAAAVVRAHAAGASADMAMLAERWEPDPFLVAEVLCGTDPEAARAFAGAARQSGAARHNDLAGLPAYVASRLKRRPSTKDIAALVASDGQRQAKAWETLAASAPSTGTDVAALAIGGNRGDALRRTGKHAEAAALLAPIADKAKALGWLRGAREAYLQAALASHGALDYAGMLTAFEKMRAVERQRKRRAWEAQALFFAANVYTELGRYDKALGQFAEALAIFRELGNSAQTVRVLIGMATAYRLSGEHSRALVFVERGLGLVRSKRRRVDLLAGLGAIRTAIGEYEAAVEAYEQALKLARESQMTARVATFLGNVGQAKMWVEDFDGARTALTEALASFEIAKHPPSIATALANLGHLELRQGRGEKALVLCERAVAMVKDLDAPFLLASLEQNVGECLLHLKQYATAGTRFAANAKLADRIGARDLLVQGQLGLMQCRLAQDDAKGALAAGRIAVAQIGVMVGGLAEGQGAEARARHARLFELATEAATRLDDPAALAEVIEAGRAMALLESLEGREKLRALSIPAALQTEESAARAALAESRTVYQRVLRSRSLPQIRKRKREVTAATKRLEAIAGRIRREAKSEAALAYPTVDDLDALQGYLEPDEAFVLYALAETSYVALVVEPKAARIVRLAPQTACDAACERVVDATSSDAGPGKAELAALRKLIVDPLKLGANVKRLLASPTGDLFLVPLSTLVPKREIAYIPSGTAYGALRGEPSGRRTDVLAFGGVDYAGYARLQDLPDSGDEATQVGTSVVLGKKVTEKAVRERLLSKRRWRAVHFACHGILDLDRPMQTALALTPAPPDDGLLSVVEVFTAKVPTDLVALSACESGRGRIYRAEGIIGLTRAFMYAGSRRVLCSLWKVDDAATSALMKEFYRLWNPKKGPRLSAAAALKKAQAHVRSQKKWRAPYYWAAWVLWGLPT